MSRTPLIALSIVVTLGAAFLAAPQARADVDPTTLSASASSMAELADHESEATCGTPRQGHASCMAEVLDGTAAPASASSAAPSGFSPADLRSAYSLPSGSSYGAGQTVAVVAAYDNPKAESDLAVYRAKYGMAACTASNGCFRRINQNGSTYPYPAYNAGWAAESTLDIEMVSAACPNCNILLVEGNSDSLTDLGTAVNQAVSMGAKFVSNSYGTTAGTSDFSYFDKNYFDHPGVAIVAATGDNGYGTSYPASSQSVTAVGGTSLTKTSKASRGWSESAWSGAGSGCSGYGTKPAWQSDSLCSTKTVADVSAVADPHTGVAMYFSGTTKAGTGWLVAGGTSTATPIIAGIYALAGAPQTDSNPSSYPYSSPDSLNDVTSGTNGSCTTGLCKAGVGADGPTGLGTPSGIAAFTTPGSGGVSRLSGATRYDASAAMSAATFAPGVPVAYISSGQKFPDALSGAALAGVNKSPVLLVTPGAIPASISRELARLKPKKIVVLGGTATVGIAVQKALAKYTSGGVTRLSGPTRFSTSAAIAARFPADVPVAYISTGDNYPDALSGGSLAAMTDGPMLLVQKNSIPSEIASALKKVKPQKIVILGGPASVSDSVRNSLSKYTTGKVSRISGATRFDVSAAISYNFPVGVDVAYVAVGTKYPDALSGAPVAAVTDSPVLLVTGNSIPSSVATALKRLKPGRIVVLGGPASVSVATSKSLAALVR